MKVLSALTASVFALSAHAAASESWVPTATKAHDPLAAVHVAPLRTGEQVSVVVSLKLRNKSELDKLTAQLMSGAASVHPLSSAEFMAKHAPNAAQAQAVVAYLRAQGFTNIDVAPNNLLVSATGTAGAIRTAFKADLHEYNVNGRRAYANVTDAMIPAHLSESVLGVIGLQNVHTMHTHAQLAHTSPQAATPQAITGVSIPNFASIYGASSLPSATTGTIGIITAGSVTQTITDLKSFASNSGYPVPNVTATVVGTPGAGTSGTDEWNMDTQSALAAAGGSIAHMILYNVTDLSDSALTLGYNKAVTDNQARAINVSLGGCETAQGSAEASQDQIFQQAVAQGQMFSVSSGDSGAYECGATAGKAQSYPAVSPYVMAIGGTTLSSSGGTWQGETVWSCTSASTCQQSSSGGAGGGPSLTENAPSWQTAAGVLAGSAKRGVPDISFDASPQSGALVLINGSNAQIGGTSLAAPLWAGFWTRIQAAHGNTLPFPAQTLYSGAASHPTWFHDVTSGNQGYAAATGWDYASGYGSVQIANFSTAFAAAPAPTPAPTPAPAPSPTPAPSPVINGGFEGSASPWTVSSGVWCTNSTCSGETAHGGTGFVWMDGYGTTHTDTVTQTFTIPAGKTAATLSFYLHVDTQETGSTAYDKLTVTMTPSGGSATTLATYSNVNAASGYVLRTINVSSFIGKSVTLKFTGTEDSSLRTSFVIDDVSVSAN